MASKEESLLLSARNGDIKSLLELLQDENLDINCKGKHKSNLGWSPLHLSAYFGHKDALEILLQNGANVNIINGMGDTPLHRAAYTGRTDVVLTLLHYNADVSIINGEGRTPLQMSDCAEVKKLISAAEKSQQLSRNEALLLATTEGDIDAVKKLLLSSVPPNINCQNLLGNTALHCAAYRNTLTLEILQISGLLKALKNRKIFLVVAEWGHKEIAVLLLQNGIDSTIKNNRGLSALEVSRDNKMRQLLDVQPLQAVHKSVQRFEGYIMKRSRFLGWKKHWVVLERGILSAFHSRADGVSGLKRQFFKYLDNAIIVPHTEDEKKFKIIYSDHTVHFFMTQDQIHRQRWVNAVREHSAYSTHYTSQPHIVLMDELDEDYMPLGSMEDAIKNAKAQQQVLEQQVASLNAYFNNLSDLQIKQGTASTLKMKLTDVVRSSRDVSSTLNHCLTILIQQEEVRRLQLQEEAEKRRVLEDALHVLAREHFVLEQSIKSQHKFGFESTIQDESDDFPDIFYDAPEDATEMDLEPQFNGNSEDKLSDLELSQELTGSNDLRSGKFNTAMLNGKKGSLSPKLRREHSKYRKRLPHTMHSRNEFSIWSVLKQAVGKDLSRIAMPVIFNEPLSFLQRITEYMDYVELLHEATTFDDPIERMKNIAIFMVSCNASTEHRVGKPFNPLLGETYELIREDMDFKLVAEQVSHHPPVSALFVESESGFQLTMSMQPDLKFWGKDIEVKPKGNVTIKIPKYNDVYTFSYISSGLHNIIIGNLWIELYGVCKIVNHTTGDKAIVNFKPAGWFGKDMNQIEGYICDKNEKRKVLMKGDWTKYVCTCDPSKSHLLNNITSEVKTPPDIADLKVEWKARPKPPGASDMYMMTEFAMGLNHLLPEHENTIPPTDCRYRPDIRHLENGDIEEAASAKLTLEEAQRARRKERELSNGVWKPLWFDKRFDEFLDCEDWFYNGEYFKRDYSKCLKIFE